MSFRDMIFPIGETILLPGDLGFTRSESPLGKAIRWFEEIGDEGPSQTNHVFVVVRGGTLQSALIGEALQRVTIHPLASAYGGGEEFALFRRVGLTMGQRMQIAAGVKSREGEGYGYGSIAAIGGDYLINKGLALLGQLFGRRSSPNVRLLRRFMGKTCPPICSTLATQAYFAACGETFGCEPDSADPDEMLDNVLPRTDGDLWAWVRHWGTIPKQEERPCLNPNAN